jgi:CRISPR-associated protein Csd1
LPIKALAHYYNERQKRSKTCPELKLPEFGYTNQKINYCLEITKEGDVAGIIPLGNPASKNKNEQDGVMMTIPDCGTVTGNAKCAIGCVNQSYLFGISLTQRDGKYYYNFCRNLHEELLKGIETDEAIAVLKFFQKWNGDENSECFADCPNISKKKLWFCIKLQNGRCLHECEEVKQAWQKHCKLDSAKNDDGTLIMDMCAVTNQKGLISRLHPKFSFAHQKPVALASYNTASLCSHGHEQGLNFPVTVEIAHSYGEAIRTLCEEQNDTIFEGATQILFWSDDADYRKINETKKYFRFADYYSMSNSEKFKESNLYPSLAENQAENCDDEDWGNSQDSDRSVEEGNQIFSDTVNSIVKENYQAGRPIVIDEGSPAFYTLGLSWMDYTASVRFFRKDNYLDLQERLKKHVRQAAVIYKGKPYSPSFNTLMNVFSNGRKPSKKNPDTLLEQMKLEFVQAVLTGRPYPRSMMDFFVMSNPVYKGESTRETKNGQSNLDCLRASFLKSYYLSNPKSNVPKEVLSMSLDTNVTNPAYLLGRLLAVADSIQYLSDPDIQRSIRDRFLGYSAVNDPRVVFNTIMAEKEYHLSKLTNPCKWEKILDQIASKLGAQPFKNRFTQDEQNMFFLGFYHQREFNCTRSKKEEEKPASTTE